MSQQRNRKLTEQSPSPDFSVHGQYGKTKVRVVRVVRHDNSRHDLTEVDVECLLEGDFEESYTLGDNQRVVPTDTIKNTIYVLAKESRFASVEDLGIALCRHFISRHSHVDKVSIKIEEKLWKRVEVEGEEHDHVFNADSEIHICRVIGTRNTSHVSPHVVKNVERLAGHTVTGVSFRITSGMKNIKLLKTTQSGFENYSIDEYTALQPTTDRIFCTMLEAEWDYEPTNLPTDFRKVNRNIREVMLSRFAGPARGGQYSKSVQETMYQMGCDAMQGAPQITNVSLTLPNIHFFQFDLQRFGLRNDGTIFYPTDDPSGLIKCKITRADMSTKRVSKM